MGRRVIFDSREELFEKRRQVLHKITVYEYWVMVVVQIAMFFIMKAAGLMYHSVAEFVLLYMVRPLGINTLIIIAAGWIIKRTKKKQLKNLIEVLAMALMLGCMAYVHHVFSVLLITFCIPIFITVFLQDKKILDVTTIVCEFMAAGISLECFLTKSGAWKDEYFTPTVIIIMIVLFACRYIAAVCIDILNEQSTALISTRNEALEAKQEAERSNRSKTVFLSNMSHEIRTPLNTVLSLDTLILRESTEDNIKAYATDIRDAGQILLSLINDILDMSKVESGKMELLETEYEFASLVHDVVNMISQKAKGKNLELLVKVDENIPVKMLGDDVRLRQILVNILGNAVKYTDAGSITFSIKGERMEDKEHLHFSVKDTGAGIKPEDMDKLYGWFERIDERKNKYIEGTGLGMSITSTLLAMMGSELQVDSVYGEGSTFSFDVQQKIIDERAIGNLENRINNRSLEENYEAAFTAANARILVVDDNMMNRHVFKGLLKETKLQIEEAESGKQCLELCATQEYDLIFLDHMMPEMDGIETLLAMKEMPENKNQNTPIIALTANAVVGAKEQYLQAGFSDYLSKPLNPSRLEQMIHHYLPQELVDGYMSTVLVVNDDAQALRKIKKQYTDTHQMILSTSIEQGMQALGSKSIDEIWLDSMAKEREPEAYTLLEEKANETDITVRIIEKEE